MPNDFGDVFQENTKYKRKQSFGHALSWSNKPETYKGYNTRRISLSFDLSLQSGSPPLLDLLSMCPSYQEERSRVIGAMA